MGPGLCELRRTPPLRLSEKSLRCPRQRVFGSVKRPKEAARSRFLNLPEHQFATHPDFSDSLSKRLGEEGKK
jgi:hypothetical protein